MTSAPPDGLPLLEHTRRHMLIGLAGGVALIAALLQLYWAFTNVPEIRRILAEFRSPALPFVTRVAISPVFAWGTPLLVLTGLAALCAATWRRPARPRELGLAVALAALALGLVMFQVWAQRLPFTQLAARLSDIG